MVGSLFCSIGILLSWDEIFPCNGMKKLFNACLQKKKEKNVCKSKEILAGKLSSFSVIKFISPCNCRMKFQLNRLKFHSSKLAAFVNIFDPICSSFNYFVMMCSQDCKIGWVALIVSKSFICKIVQVRYNNHWKGKPTIWEQ